MLFLFIFKKQVFTFVFSILVLVSCCAQHNDSLAIFLEKTLAEKVKNDKKVLYKEVFIAWARRFIVSDIFKYEKKYLHNDTEIYLSCKRVEIKKYGKSFLCFWSPVGSEGHGYHAAVISEKGEILDNIILGTTQWPGKYQLRDWNRDGVLDLVFYDHEGAWGNACEWVYYYKIDEEKGKITQVFAYCYEETNQCSDEKPASCESAKKQTIKFINAQSFYLNQYTWIKAKKKGRWKLNLRNIYAFSPIKMKYVLIQ